MSNTRISSAARWIRAKAVVILTEYGGIPEFLEAHGYGTGGKNARRVWNKRRGR